jgi:hypothetical protein
MILFNSYLIPLDLKKTFFAEKKISFVIYFHFHIQVNFNKNLIVVFPCFRYISVQKSMARLGGIVYETYITA